MGTFTSTYPVNYVLIFRFDEQERGQKWTSTTETPQTPSASIHDNL
jgi:hypothetical protein